jgi:undecaprenyl-diphosphatase
MDRLRLFPMAALAALWLAMLMLGAGAVDRTLLVELYGGHRPTLADAARLVTMLGDGRLVTVLTLIGGIVLLLRKHRQRALALVVGTLVGRGLVELQKYEIGRLRPDANPHLVAVHNLSYPSGHSANAMLVYLVLALMLVEDPRRRTWCIAAALLLAALVGTSRVVLGVHWPSDVLGGWAFGALWAIVVLWSAGRAVPSAGSERRDR